MNATATTAAPVQILFSRPASARETTYTPATGTAERNVILAVLRRDLYSSRAEAASNPENILFVVRHLRVKGRWILVNAAPTRNGKLVGKPRWDLIQKSGNQYQNRRYRRAISPHLSKDNQQISLEMNAITKCLIRRAFPTCPPEIFP